MTYKYVSLGLNPGHVSGKVTWYHDECAIKLSGVGAGGHPEKTDESPPKGTKCYWCGKEIASNSERVNGNGEKR